MNSTRVFSIYLEAGAAGTPLRLVAFRLDCYFLLLTVDHGGAHALIIQYNNFMITVPSQSMGNAQAAAAARQAPPARHVVPPGAYSVPGNPSMRANQQFYVLVPKGAVPGKDFACLAGGYQLMVSYNETEG
jgi:hypothetical protein